jgi:hypothetical protein
MGGAKLAVDGGVFHPEPSANRIKFHGDWPVADSQFVGPALDSDDEFASKPHEGTIAWTVPPAHELLGASFQTLAP